MLLLGQLLLILTSLILWTRAEIYTAQVELANLVRVKEAVLSSLRKYAELEAARIQEFKTHLTDFLERPTSALGSSSSGSSVSDIVENPLNAFLLVKSLSTDLEYILKIAEDKSNSELLKRELENLEKNQEFPKSEDLTGAVQAIIRLQNTYKLEAGKMSTGLLGQFCCSAPLKVEDLFEMGRQSFFQRDYAHTIEWMNEALLQYAEKELEFQNNGSSNPFQGLSPFTSNQNQTESSLFSRTPSKVSRKDIEEYLNSASQIQSVFDMTKQFFSDTEINYDSIFDSLSKTFNQETEMLGEDDGKVVDKSRYSWVKAKYEALCRGESSKIKLQLGCSYQDNGSPYLRIGPVRAEMVNSDPEVYFYHNVLFDSEIAYLKKMAQPNLATSLVQDYINGGSQFSTVRTSKNTWLDDGDSPIVEKITKRIMSITGLSMESAEELQIANYGLGGHYEPHYDFSTSPTGTFEHFEQEVYGNRIATFLFYMSDVKAGGATVFPAIDLAVWPEKGGASFWYNLHDDGEPDYRTRHAACPVLIGSKWVSNKWLHERGQEFRRRCKPRSKKSKI